MSGAQRRRGLASYRDTVAEPSTASAQVTMDEKAALWLLAWSSRERPVQRREALAMLGALAWRPSPGQMPEEA